MQVCCRPAQPAKQPNSWQLAGLFVSSSGLRTHLSSLPKLYMTHGSLAGSGWHSRFAPSPTPHSTRSATPKAPSSVPGGHVTMGLNRSYLHARRACACMGKICGRLPLTAAADAGPVPQLRLPTSAGTMGGTRAHSSKAPARNSTTDMHPTCPTGHWLRPGPLTAARRPPLSSTARGSAPPPSATPTRGTLQSKADNHTRFLSHRLCEAGAAQRRAVDAWPAWIH